MNGKKFSWKFKNLGILSLVIVGVVLMLSGSVDAYSSSGTCYCSDCYGCYNALNNNACTTVNLNADIANHNGTCINDPGNFNNKIFDCQGHTIEGNKTKDSYGILLSKKFNNTIKNCVIKNFDYGIYIYASLENKIINNTLNSNNYGIYVSSPKSLSCSNANSCIHSSFGDYVYSEIERMFVLISDNEESSNNEISNNSACGNEILDISLNNEGENFGNNICDKISNNTNTMVFCSKSCGSSEKQKTLFLYYCDYDNDSYLSKSISGYCFGYESCIPAGCSLNKGNDCNDYNSTIHPNANEMICNEIDEDCEGFDKCGKKVWASDKHTNKKTTYYSYQDVYVSGTGFNPNSKIDVYILPCGSVNLTSDSVVKRRVTTDENGNFVALLWTLPLWNKLSTYYYNIFVDENLNGIYENDEAIDSSPFRFKVDPIWAADKGGIPKSEFKLGENVYINGNGLSVTNTTIDLYIIPNIKVSEGDPICSNGNCLNVSKSVKAEVDEKGTFKSVVFYSKDLQPGEYKVLPDLDRDGIIDAEDILAMNDLNYVGFVITNEQAPSTKKANGKSCSSNDECESEFCFIASGKTAATKIWGTCQDIQAVNGKSYSVSFTADNSAKYILTDTFISSSGKVYTTNYTLTDVASNAVNTEIFNFLAKGTHCFTLKRCDASDNCNAGESLGCVSINFGCGAAKVGEQYLVSWKKGDPMTEYGSLTNYDLEETTFSNINNYEEDSITYEYDTNTTSTVLTKQQESVITYVVRSCYGSICPPAYDVFAPTPDEGCIQIFKDSGINKNYNITCYADLDNDSYTNNTNTVYSNNDVCPAHYKNSSTTQDCNDNDSAINPSENETTYGIDGKDNNCNGIVDDCSPANSSINTQIYCSASGQMAYKKGFNATCSGNYECLSGNCTNGRCAGYISHENVNKSGFGNTSNYIGSNSRVGEIPIKYVTTTHQISTTIPVTTTPGSHCFKIECTTNEYQDRKLVARSIENVLSAANIILTLPNGSSVNIYINANGEICYNFECGVYKVLIPKGVCGDEYSKTIIATYGKLHITPSDSTKAKVNEDLTYIIKDDSGNVVKGAKVSIILPDKNLVKTSNFEGKITFNVGEKEGSYTLTVQKNCYENDTLIGTIVMPKLTLKCDPPVVRTGETLCCHVTDNGNSVEGATVALTMPDGKEIQLTSDTNGKACTSETQISGNVNATASKEGYKNSNTVTIKITECNVFGVPCWVFVPLFVIIIVILFIIWIKLSPPGK